MAMIKTKKLLQQDETASAWINGIF